jgi:Zn finger protein HypA/HybF involved in hydrogenase expression
MKIDMSTITCKRCGHTWVPRKSDVRTCPNCRSVYFDRELEKPKENKPKVLRRNM